MPEVDSNRKRSRSPSDSDQQQHKRVNTGGASLDGPLANSTDPLSQSTPSDITMAMADSSSAASNANDTNSSTPNSSIKKDETIDDKSMNEDKNGKDNMESATTSGEPSSSSTTGPPPSANIHMRCLIVTQDASIIIGKGGSHVNEIREKSGARVMVSESIPGNPERILNVSGPLDAVSKVIYNSISCSSWTNF
jgi:heterogeneous nuclear rnp K-like protein 2